MTSDRAAPESGDAGESILGPTARILAVEAMAGAIAQHLSGAGVPSLVLKGPSVAEWLYEPDELRVSGDVDVLVSPAHFARAEAELGALGFVSRYDGPAPAWAEEHADTWLSDRWPLPVDLHRRIWGCAVPPHEVWAVLWGSRETCSLAGREVHFLGIPARTLLVVLHAAHHGPDAPRPQADLKRALTRVDVDTWTEVASIAEAVGAVEGLAFGLAMRDEGIAIRDRLAIGPGDAASVAFHPRMWEIPQSGEGLLRVIEAPTSREAARILFRELFPSRSFMRLRTRESRIARRGHLGLIVAYPARWVRLAPSLPHALATIVSRRR